MACAYTPFIRPLNSSRRGPIIVIHLLSQQHNHGADRTGEYCAQSGTVESRRRA